jgi:hypothetical protein
VAVAEPVPATTATSAPKADRSADAEYLKTEGAKTSSGQTATPDTTEPVVKRKSRHDGKTVRRHDGKEVKEVLPPIAEGPLDSVPDLPISVSPPPVPPIIVTTPTTP